MGPAVAALWLAGVVVVSVRLVQQDLRDRLFGRVDIVVLNLLALVGVVMPTSAHSRQIGFAVILAVVAVVVALMLYQMKLLGGGDVKITFAVVALVARFGDWAWLVYLGFLIAVGALVLIAWRRAQPDSMMRTEGLPLAPPLLVGLSPSLLAAFLLN